MITLQYERLRLRELSFTDLDVMAAMLADPEVMADWPAPLDRVAERLGFTAGPLIDYKGLPHILCERAIR